MDQLQASGGRPLEYWDYRTGAPCPCPLAFFFKSLIEKNEKHFLVSVIVSDVSEIQGLSSSSLSITGSNRMGCANAAFCGVLCP